MSLASGGVLGTMGCGMVLSAAGVPTVMTEHLPHHSAMLAGSRLTLGRLVEGHEQPPEVPTERLSQEEMATVRPTHLTHGPVRISMQVPRAMAMVKAVVAAPDRMVAAAPNGEPLCRCRSLPPWRASVGSVSRPRATGLRLQPA